MNTKSSDSGPRELPKSYEKLYAWGSLPSQLAHFDLYRSFAQYHWSTVMSIFDHSAKVLARDPRTRQLLEGCGLLAGFRRSLGFVRAELPEFAACDDEELLTRIIERRESLRFEIALFHIFAERSGPSPFRQFLTTDAACIQRARALIEQYGAVLISGPHVGAYDGCLPVWIDLFGLEAPNVYYGQPARAFEANCRFVDASPMPDWLKPRMISPVRASEGVVTRLRAGESVFMLSDVTTAGKSRGRFTGTLGGRSWHAPSGPVRMAAAAGVPLIVTALTRTAPDEFHIHADLVWEPDSAGPVELDDAGIQAVIDRKWALFETYRRADPLSWDALALMMDRPPAEQAGLR